MKSLLHPPVARAIAQARRVARLSYDDPSARMIVGVISLGGELDTYGHRFDYEASAPVAKRWALDIKEGRAECDLRVRHGRDVVGRVTRVLCDDTSQTISVIARVEKADAWRDCSAGVFRGLSRGWIRSEAVAGGYAWAVPPTEVSLGPSPVIPSARFLQLQPEEPVRKATTPRVASAARSVQPARKVQPELRKQVPDLPLAKLIGRIQKIDAEKREITGIMACEEVDKSGEVFDYGTSADNVRAWSAKMYSDTDGKSYGNVREMHSNIAAGKVTDIDFDDANRCISITAKIVNDDTWERVVSGVLTGLSIGGRYEKKWPDIIDGKTVTRYTADPSEVSLVDRPCMPSALITDIAKMQLVGISPEVLTLYRKLLPRYTECCRLGRAIRERQNIAKVTREATDATLTALFGPVGAARLLHRPKYI